MRRYLFENVMNMRDLGGYPINLCSQTQYTQFIRSDEPIKVSGHEAEILSNNKINTIVDLRTFSETQKRPCAFKNFSGFKYFWQPFDDGVNSIQTEEDIPNSYLHIANEKSAMYTVMKIFSESENGILFHCAAGKDRTGVVSAILLSLAGVSKSDILADYQVSSTYIRKIIEQVHLDNPGLPSFLGQSKIEYMEAFLELFYKTYGSAQNYLLDIGLCADEIQKIISKLTTAAV